MGGATNPNQPSLLNSARTYLKEHDYQPNIDQSQYPSEEFLAAQEKIPMSKEEAPMQRIEKRKEIIFDMPKAKGQYDNSPIENSADVRGNAQNSQGRDTSISEYMRAKTYKKQSKRPLNAPTADFPDEQ
jgi:tRNA(Ile)-lysidine synthase TilS/MesJ